MLDIKTIRQNSELIKSRLNTRGKDYSSDIDSLLNNDKKRRSILTEVETLKSNRNEVSKLIGQYKREGKDVSPILSETNSIGEKIKELDTELQDIDNNIKDILLDLPNLPHESITVGIDENDNVEIKKYSEPTEFNFEVKAHWDLGVELDILDFERASKITGSRFVVYKGLGARLERALISFMMDLHSTEHGYTEVIPPFIVNRKSMLGTGQLPKFEEDAFKLVDEREFFLNPTAEVPTINLHRDEVIDASKLPYKYCSFTTAFRQEAGSAGRDTRGILRQHQFNKVELIKIVSPETSYQELDDMLTNSEKVLQLLEIPYRVIELCSGDLGFSMAKTYDIEVWLPYSKTFREIGSISNAEDFQARRANIKFKKDKDSKLEFVHTLNGSGLAVGRTVIAIMENYQQEDGSIKVPKVLIPYMGGIEYIK